jgi:DNA-directed RNA polymerase subunit RPC12/RpoP
MGSRRGGYDDDDRPVRRGFRCPYCGSREVPVTRSKISAAGWVTFVVLLLFCLPLFWIGLLIKEEYRECYECGMRIGG